MRILAGLTIILLAIIAWLSIRPAGRYHLEMVLSGSMRPSLREGSLILLEEAPEGGFREGDIIAFTRPRGGREIIVHRVSTIEKTEWGEVAKTKGDANTNGDPWLLDTRQIMGKVILGIPWLGYPIGWLNTTIGFLVFTTATLHYIVGRELRGLLAAIVSSVVWAGKFGRGGGAPGQSVPNKQVKS